MCVLNPAPRNPGWKWGRGGGYNWYQSQKLNSSEASPRSEQRKILEPRCSGVLEAHERINKELVIGQADGKYKGKQRVSTPMSRIQVLKDRHGESFAGVSSPVHRYLRKTHALLTKGNKGVSPTATHGGNMVHALFPDEEEMEFVEQTNAHIRETTNAHIRETTSRCQVLMPHFQKAAEYRLMYQGHGTFQFTPEVEMTPPRGHPRMEDSVPTRKHGRLRKITSIDADRLRSMNGVCRCGTLMQAKQGPRSVWEYTEEFMETAKRCKPKLTEDWCRWYKAGLREEIQGKLLGVLEPWEFALVNRMAGQAMKAKMALTVGSSPSRALRRKWMWKMICGRHRLWMKEPREDVPSRASVRPLFI
uniref:Retrotransposon gag domain-containing protein n=1 Tax=Brassica oleracea var. oleracea TaxID=109376 RepID=A0A0D3D2Y9_BRAOL